MSRRQVTLKDTVQAPVTFQMKSEARKAWIANKLKNINSIIEKRSRDTLYSQMKESGIKSFDFITEISDGNKGTKKQSISVEIAEGSTTICDIQKLKSLVSPDDFLKIISATKGAVEKFSGKNVASEVFTTKPSGEFSVKVKSSK